MKNLLLLLLLLLPAAASAAPPAGDQDDPAAWLKAAINRDWTARVEESGYVVFSSPNYALPFNQGCVIHRLHFRIHDGRPMLGDMVAEDRYFAFASGDGCAAVDASRFFGIEPNNDVFSLLDFARRLKAGPKSGRDRLPDGALAMLSPCFSPEGIGTTQIVRAHSWRPKDSRRDQYQVTLTCAALPDQAEIVALGARDQEAITWKAGVLEHVTVDLAVPTDAKSQ